jgi:phosphatidylglycerophosphate synthase
MTMARAFDVNETLLDVADRFDAIISADQVRALKPRPEPRSRRGCRSVFEPYRSDAVLTEGERWTREQLRALLARGFTPAAVRRFLWESSRRSASVRRRRRAVARRARRWTAVGGVAWLGLAAAGVQPFRRRLRLGLAWWSAAGLMLDWHLGMFETVDGRPRNLGAADALTLTRAWLIPVALDTPTPIVCGLAAATDALDGPVARRAGPTRAGRDLEGLVDACFAAAALRGAVRHGWLPPAIAGTELLRMGVGFGYVVMVYFGAARSPSRELLRAARVTSAVRAAGLVLAGTSRRRAGGALIAAGAVTSVALGIAAVARGERALRRPRTRSAPHAPPLAARDSAVW